MNKKLLYLTKISINKKIKTKWFLIANIIFAVLIVGLLNIDSIIEFFGGDFNHTTNIYILDESGYGVSDSFEMVFNQYEDYMSANTKVEIVSSNEEGYDLVEKDKDNNSILVVVEKDIENYLKAKIVSNSDVDSILYQFITSSLDGIKREYALAYHGIDSVTMANINSSVSIERIKLSDEESSEDNMDFLMGVIFPILILPVFMLTMFLIQMIGAEINEEKATRGMEIIISNVSAKTHFMSKLISGNCFVLVQGLLLIIYVVMAVGVRFMMTGTFDVSALLGTDGMNIMDTMSKSLFNDSLVYIIPFTLILIILSFIGYSLLAAITSSMTTNMEDFQQVQTPIVLVSLVGYYLAMMASMFEGSLFIRIFSYVPFISTMLSPALLMLGQISILDVVVSIVVMIGVIYVLVKYGLRIYKVGILNYSSANIWKKMFKAARNK